MTFEFFSINIKNLPLEVSLSFHLYIDASVKKSIKFVKILARGDHLTEKFRQQILEKYGRVFIAEEQRKQYFDFLRQHYHLATESAEDIVDVEEVRIVKDLAISHLQDIFSAEGEGELIESLKKTPQVVETMVKSLQGKSIEQLKNIIAKLSFHDFYTFDHSINVCLYSLNIYPHLFPKQPSQSVLTMGVGALLHDIGKLKVATQIINKPGSLSDEEFAQIKKHPSDGVRILQSIKSHLPQGIQWDVVAKIIEQHHENVDGSGYPHGLGDIDIHHMAKVCAISDIFDALTTKRSYNEVLPIQKAVEVMGSLQNKKLDSDLFKLFLEVMGRSINLRGRKITLPEKFDPSSPFRNLEIHEEKKEIKDIPTKVVKSY